MNRLCFVFALAALAGAASAQIFFDKRHSVYTLSGAQTDYSDAAYTYVTDIFIRSGSLFGEDYRFEWSQKSGGSPVPPTVTSDMAFDYLGINANGKHEYMFHMPNNQQHWFRIVYGGAVGADFDESWMVRETSPEDGHEADLLFKGDGFLTSPAAEFRVDLRLMNFITSEGASDLQAQVLAESTPHQAFVDAGATVLSWVDQNVDRVDMDVRLHGLLVPEPNAIVAALAGVGLLLAARRRPH